MFRAAQNVHKQTFNNQVGVVPIFILLAAIGLVAFILIANTAGFKDGIFRILFPKPTSQAAGIRGQSGDFWADIIIGKPDFGQIGQGTTVDHYLWNPKGTVVDTTVTPNILYIYDGGNNRILGINLGKCLSANNNLIAGCSADLIIGQPASHPGDSGYGLTSACNGDSNYQNFPNRNPASASSLCSLQEDQLSPQEGGGGSSMSIDSQGNLYVTDTFNHRVLKYNRPSTTDTVADQVWGQADFSGNLCNKGLGFNSVNATTLCFIFGGFQNASYVSGVDGRTDGSVWVADMFNNRVLHFPANSKTADIVLGQPNFTSNGSGNSLNQMWHPAAVKVTSKGVYVADYGNARVLLFTSPTTGSSGTLLASGIGASGFGTDPTEPGKIWITDVDSSSIALYNETTKTKERDLGAPNSLNGWPGSVGFDSQGDAFISNYQGEKPNDVYLFPKGATTNYSRILFGTGEPGGGYGVGNARDTTGLAVPFGLVVSNNQLISSDFGRVVFWNNPASLTSNKPADGVIGVGSSDFATIRGGCCESIKADNSNHLYVVLGANCCDRTDVEIYQLPLTNGAQPIKTLKFPLTTLEGQQLDLAHPFVVLTGIAPSNDGKFLWISDGDQSRVLRVRDPLGLNPRVDVILGQTNTTGTSCNRDTANYANYSAATNNTLCFPGTMSFDRNGNLFISDSSFEARGNRRLIIYAANTFPTNNTSTIFAPSDSKYNPLKIMTDIATWEPAFDSQNHMVIGYNPMTINSYLDQNGGGRFPGYYLNPLAATTGSNPDGFLKDYYSEPVGSTFDSNDNLYVTDHNRGKLLIYKNPFSNPTSADYTQGNYYSQASYYSQSSYTTASPPASGNCNVNITANGVNPLTLASSPVIVTLDWTSSGDADGTLQASGNWGPGNVSSSGSTTVSPQSADTYTYNLACTGADGITKTTSVVVTVTGTSTVLGDINNSGKVDIFDFNILLTDYGKTDSTSLRSDLNGSGKVDIFDFNILLTNFGKTN